jgi:hypothetical protein
MQAIAAAVISGPMTSQAPWYAEGLTPSIDRTVIATDINSRQLVIVPPGAYDATSGQASTPALAGML